MPESQQHGRFAVTAASKFDIGRFLFFGSTSIYRIWSNGAEAITVRAFEGDHRAGHEVEVTGFPVPPGHSSDIAVKGRLEIDNSGGTETAVGEYLVILK